jgi:hypothetical protein
MCFNSLTRINFIINESEQEYKKKKLLNCITLSNAKLFNVVSNIV